MKKIEDAIIFLKLPINMTMHVHRLKAFFSSFHATMYPKHSKLSIKNIPKKTTDFSVAANLDDVLAYLGSFAKVTIPE